MNNATNSHKQKLYYDKKDIKCTNVTTQASDSSNKNKNEPQTMLGTYYRDPKKLLNQTQSNVQQI